MKGPLHLWTEINGVLSLIYCNRELQLKPQIKDIWVDGHLVAYFPGFKVFQDSLPPFSATQLSFG